MVKRSADGVMQEPEGLPEAKAPRFTVDIDDDTDDAVPSRRHCSGRDSQSSTPTTTPEQRPAPPPAEWAEQLSACLEHISTSPEARAKALNSELGHLPVKELKERLWARGANIASLHEKEELVELLEELAHQDAGHEQDDQGRFVL